MFESRKLAAVQAADVVRYASLRARREHSARELVP